MHWKRQRQRDYNQSEVIAKEISAQINQPMVLDVKRLKNTASQTSKSKYLRWEDEDKLFEINKSIDLSYQHIILVDDIITTGATVTKCLHALEKVDGVSVSIISVAYS